MTNSCGKKELIIITIASFAVVKFQAAVELDKTLTSRLIASALKFCFN